MLRLIRLYYGLIAFWGTYISIAPLLPQSEAKTRPIAKITKEKVIRNIICNCAITFLMVPIISLIPQVLWLSSTWYGYIIKYSLGLILADTWFYYTHRLLHRKRWYQWHSDHHAFIQPHALAGLYCSWLEMILVNQLTVGLPCQLLGFSQMEIIISSILVSLNVMKGHAGLQLYQKYSTWLPNWLISSRAHDIHHEQMISNYGVLYLLDWIHGTYKS